MNKADLETVITNIHKLLDLQILQDAIEEHAQNHQQDFPKTLLIDPHILSLRNYLNQLHPADTAHLLEAFSTDERLFIWQFLTAIEKAKVLLELPHSLKESLLEDVKASELIEIATNLDSDELADITPYLEDQTIEKIISALDEQSLKEYESAKNYQENQIGSRMDFDILKVREDVTCKVVFRYLRRFDELPGQVDKIFVVDDYNTLLGALSIRKLLTSNPKTLVKDLFNKDIVTFSPQDDIEDVANAFERYDLVTAPVVDKNHHLVGRVTIDEMMDVMRSASDADMLNMAGINAIDELFSPVWESFKARWLWLVINLCTAFLASRVIGLFEDSIEKIVVLATLMPIVAGLGGNSGNQTITMIVRAMAQHRFSWPQINRLLYKELLVAALNGIIWGGVLGCITYLLYGQFMLSFVMFLAMTLNLLLAAFMGVIIPATMQKIGRDPALGSSVLITACTDSGGFFIFLGLASILLM